ncbi:MAG TPA: hypothetical protein VF648_06510 [Pyrinomonadaceae bacterium]|jgi:hypothetical protein
MINEKWLGDDGRQEYLNYLKENNLSEADVLPIIPEANQFKNNPKIAAVLLRGLLEGHEELVKKLIDVETLNTNKLLEQMNKSLLERFKASNVSIEESAYLGVFPTNSINAHIVRREGGYLILVNTGLFELLETIISLFFSVDIGKEKEIAKVAAEQIRQYCKDRTLPDPFKIDCFTKDQSRIATATQIVNSAEEFVICHEYGHLIDGHVGHALADLFITPKLKIKVETKTYQQELEADMWGLYALTSIKSHIGKSLPDSEERLMVCSGPLFFLLIAALIEEYTGKKGNETHPPAQTRFLEMRMALSKAGLSEYTYLAKFFRAFSFLVAEELGVKLGGIGDIVMSVVENRDENFKYGYEEITPISEQFKNLKEHHTRINNPTEKKKDSWWKNLFNFGFKNQ